MDKIAPIIIFAFNRPKSFASTVEALKSNPESKDSDLFIFIDGPRSDRPDEEQLVNEVKAYADSISGFKSINCSASHTNQGLGPSIIKGVSEVIEKYGAAIVLEDDLIVQPNFLAFMNQGLTQFEHNEKVWSICGYTNKIKIPENYHYDGYFCTRSSSWGWGTWRDRWESVDWSFDKWGKWSKLKKEFNNWGGSDCFGMLDACRCGRNKSWAIRFCFNQFIQDKLSLFPIKSLVNNNGFDGQGTNCKKYSRFKFELMNPTATHFIFPDISLNLKLKREAMKYNGLLIRSWSRLMYILK